MNKENPSVVDVDTMRHSAAHILACAVQQLYPQTKLAIGPTTTEGFYYDMDIPQSISVDDLSAIESVMTEIIASDFTFEREEWDKRRAKSFFAERNEVYKVELIDGIEGNRVGIYRTGPFIDLCRGPHVPSTKYIRAFKLLSVAGAYWRGSEKNKMLQRIYGTAFNSEAELKDYLYRLEEAKERDHRKLGKELEFFDFHDQVGAGLVVWFPKGAMLKNLIEDYWKRVHRISGYQLVSTPHLGKADLWRQSGHLDFYAEHMYAAMEVEEQPYYLKPMNCPFHIGIYTANWHSYRDLPIRLAELGTVYRYELSGVLHGLMRVRGFTQDDAHIICTPEQVEEEVIRTIDLAIRMLKTFGFNAYEIFVSTRPTTKSIGDEERWSLATRALKQALVHHGLQFQIDEGGGAFYGPKIDIKIKDALSRAWQCSTIQFDFNLPERFKMFYIGADGKEHRPYMIHRALLGSLERFIGVLIEHYKGSLPVWLSPVQLKVIAVSEKFSDEVFKIHQAFLDSGIRSEVDVRSEKVGYKIREAEKKKIPFMVVIGEKELQQGVLALRRRGREDLGSHTFEKVVALVREAETLN